MQAKPRSILLCKDVSQQAVQTSSGTTIIHLSRLLSLWQCVQTSMQPTEKLVLFNSAIYDPCHVLLIERHHCQNGSTCGHTWRKSKWQEDEKHFGPMDCTNDRSERVFLSTDKDPSGQQPWCSSLNLLQCTHVLTRRLKSTFLAGG